MALILFLATTPAIGSSGPAQAIHRRGQALTAWTHDIFYSDIDPHNPKISPIKIISNPEAQEPASSAISDDGHIMITMEDGWNAKNVVAQRYGLYDQSMNPVKPYPNTALDGGHSGHVAASGNRFVIFYSEGWVNDGGVDKMM